MVSIADLLQLAVAHHRAGDWQQAERTYRQLLEQSPHESGVRHQLAWLLFDRNRHAEAIEQLSAAIASSPDQSLLCSHLGIFLRAAGKPEEAVRQFQAAIGLNPNDFLTHYNLGNAYQQLGRFELAIESYQSALRGAPDDPDAYLNLGAAQWKLGRLSDAATSLNQAIAIKSDFPQAHYNLARVRRDQNKLDEAAASLRRALELQPNYAEAHNQLGVVLGRQEKVDEAIACHRRALHQKPDLVEAHFNLGTLLDMQGQLAEAADCWRRGLELNPDFAEGFGNLGSLLTQVGQIAEAKECYLRALERHPNQGVWRLNIASLCPGVFGHGTDIVDYRSTLLAELETFAGAQPEFKLPPLATIACIPPFNLQFHGYDDRPIREAYAKVFRSCFATASATRSSGRPRIGFVVTDRHEALFLRSLGGVLERMNTDRFELVVMGSARGTKTLDAALCNPAIKQLSLPAEFEQAVEAIRAEQVDLLYYWEVATDIANYFLPFHRLAPVQCTSWGIQVTSGIPQMDYYLSSALVEPEDASTHYTEQLVLASTLLTYQRRAPLPDAPKPRESFGIEREQHLYLCAQQLGKFHPDFDPILAGILRADTQGVLVATEDRFGHFLGNQLRARWSAAMPDVAERVLFVPYQSQAEYLNLVAAADVLLDPLHFGGVNSSYDGFSLNKPIVTLPSQFQRGRYTLGCYKKMNLTQCVASDANHYLDIAVALGTDARFRAQVTEQIERASPVLFEDMEAVREHERIFSTLVELARTGTDGRCND